MIKNCGSSFRGKNRYTRKELDDLAKLKGIMDYKSKNMDELCNILGLINNIPKKVNKTPSIVYEIPLKNIPKKTDSLKKVNKTPEKNNSLINKSRPCDSKNRNKNRYTRKELDDIAKLNGIQGYKSKNMDELCNILKNFKHKSSSLEKKQQKIEIEKKILKKQKIQEEDSFLSILNISVVKNHKNEEKLYNMINDKKIFVYLITNDDVNEKYENVTNINVNQLFTLFKKLKTDDDVRNLIIVKNNYDNNNKKYTDYSTNVNDQLINLEYENIILKNTYIINFTNITTSIIYNTYTVSNIINIVPSNDILYSNLGFYKFKLSYKYTIIDNKTRSMEILTPNGINKTDVNYNISNVLTNFNPKKYNVYVDSTKDFKLMVGNIHSTKDIIDYFINVKICSYTKLMQFTGTCWANSVMNSLLLSSKYTLLLKAYYSTWFNQATQLEKDEITNKDIRLCLNPKYSLEKYLIIIIYNVLIKNVKPTQDDDNLVAMVAAKLKHIYQMNSKYDKIITIKDAELYSDSGRPYTTFKFLYDFILKNDYIHLYDINLVQSNMSNKKIISASFNTTDYNKKVKFNPTLTFTNALFTIENCIIIIETKKNQWNHVICGFKCNNEYYIYDSNNVLLKHNWVLNPICQEYLNLTGYNSMNIFIISYINNKFI